jgi:TonB family C-terminal domain
MGSFKKLAQMILTAIAVSTPCAANADAPYIQSVEKSVRRCWNPPKETVPYKVTVNFRVWKNGAVTDLTVHNSSGSSGADEAALRAVRQAAPFAGLPEGTAEFMEIEFDLKYAVNTDKLKGENDPKDETARANRTAKRTTQSAKNATLKNGTSKNSTSNGSRITHRRSKSAKPKSVR